MQENNNQGESKINEDIFGVTYNKETGERVQVKPEEDKGKDKGGKEDGKDKDETPLEKELRNQIKKLEEDKKSMGGNLSKQGELLKDLQKQLEEIKKNKGTNQEQKPDLPYKEIKRSKDLTQDERDDMTQSELKMMDQLAEMQEKANQDFLKQLENAKKDEGDGEDDDNDEGDDKNKQIPEDFEKNVMTFAMEMTGGDTDMANKILAEFNQFADNYKLDEKGLKERLEKASKLVPGFVLKPTKSINGGSSAGKDTGTSFIDNIVDAASSKAKGGGKSFSL